MVMRKTMFLLLLLIPFCAQAQEPVELRVPKAEKKPFGKEEIISFADFLFREGDYERAATEYRRFCFLYPEENDVPYALFQAGVSLEKCGRYKTARKLFKQFYRKRGDKKASIASSYRIACTYIEEKYYPTAVKYLGNYENSWGKLPTQMRYLRGYAYLKMGSYSDAIEELSSLNVKGSSLSSATYFLISKAKQGAVLPRKSPVVSGLLSAVVPGAGRAYCDKWGDAIFSLLSVGIPAGIGYALMEKDRGFSNACFFLSVSFYLSDIYGSTVDAIKYNRDTERHFQESIDRDIPVAPTEIFSDYSSIENK
ncbi:hypothetical protein J7K18_04420 [bacterium]|nr:hypothetical protein [bacterium]